MNRRLLFHVVIPSRRSATKDLASQIQRRSYAEGRTSPARSLAVCAARDDKSADVPIQSNCLCLTKQPKTMIQLSRNYSLPEKQEDDFAIKIIGVGGAGTNALDRIVLDGMEHAEMIAVNTDVQSLASSVATRKVQIGREATRGLGAGGDPELGYNAAHESADELREALQGARMVFVCAGLGRRNRFRRGSVRGANGARDRSARPRFCHFALRLRRQAPHRAGH